MSALLLLAVMSAHGAVQPSLPPVIPKPVSMTAGTGGSYTITARTTLDGDRFNAGGLLQEMLLKGAGFTLKRARRPGQAGAIEFESRSGRPMAEGAYELHVDHTGIVIRCTDKGGAIYAIETLRQLLPPEIEGPKPSTTTQWTVPAIDITDYPRFSWRGMHLDVSRHFFPTSYIKKYLDYIAMMKMNVFHWHLVDDGGWRIQIDKYPRLTSVGAWRYGVTTGWDQGKLRFDPQSGLPKYGGFYTKQEIRDIVKYAANLNINVVPEIEMPGHTMPVIAAYPELECQNQAPQSLQGQPSSNVYCAGNENTYKFIFNVLDEVMALFPSKWIHIGGDEVNKQFWHRCPLCQARMKAEGLKNEEELQSYFIRRIDKYLTSKGRRLIGWDEILEGGLAKGATVMSWRGIDGGIAAARSDHDVVMSPTSHCYFDYGYDGQSTRHVYTFEPVPSALNEVDAKHVLGGQANVWTERIPTEARCDYMIWPRMAAMAEVLWSPAKERDSQDFLARVPSLYPRLDRMGTSYYMPAPRVAENAILFDKQTEVKAIVEPRMSGRLHYTTDGTTPNSRSPKYIGPIAVTKPEEIQLAYLESGGHVGDVAKVDCVPLHADSPGRTNAGWQVGYFEGSWKQVPNFQAIEPVITGYENRLGFDMRRRDEDFALDLKGYFKADKDGVYLFSLSSDDGSWLKVGGATLIDNDGLHGNDAKDGKIWLPKGWHRVEIGYFQAGGAYGLSLQVQPPDAKKLVDAGSFIFTDAR